MVHYTNDVQWRERDVLIYFFWWPKKEDEYERKSERQREWEWVWEMWCDTRYACRQLRDKLRINRTWIGKKSCTRIRCLPWTYWIKGYTRLHIEQYDNFFASRSVYTHIFLRCCSLDLFPSCIRFCLFLWIHMSSFAYILSLYLTFSQSLFSLFLVLLFCGCFSPSYSHLVAFRFSHRLLSLYVCMYVRT